MSTNGYPCGIYALRGTGNIIKSVVVQFGANGPFKVIGITEYNLTYSPPPDNLPTLERENTADWTPSEDASASLHKLTPSALHPVRAWKQHNSPYFFAVVAGIRFFGTIQQIAAEIKIRFPHFYPSSSQAPDSDVNSGEDHTNQEEFYKPQDQTTSNDITGGNSGPK